MPECAELPSTATEDLQPTPSGTHFMLWLHQHIKARKLIINDAKALVHTVADTVYLVSPGVFPPVMPSSIQRLAS